MRESIKRLVWIGLLCQLAWFPGNSTVAQTEDPAYRPFPQEQLEELRSDEDFQYEKKSYETLPLWTRFENWLSELLRNIFGAAPSGNTIRVIFYVLATLLLAWAIVKLVGIDFNTVVKGPKKMPGMPYQVGEENLGQIDLSREIEAARTQGKWRLLIRLQYLYALAEMAEDGVLQITKGKTNHDYLYEISSPALRDSFARLSRIFEYTWYGQFEAGQGVRLRAEQALRQLQKHLGR
ncbi:MAG: DUF4129 domain-containing protein [Owenweeksia sp.]|nr:DUF4129 domain-containing protein [Owenweeksia sp.]